MGIAALGDEDLNGVDRRTTGIRFRWALHSWALRCRSSISGLPAHIYQGPRIEADLRLRCRAVLPSSEAASASLDVFGCFFKACLSGIGNKDLASLGKSN